MAKYLDEWLMASMGASTLLVFALPQRLMAQPLAANLSILGIFVLRCLHPPAAA